MVREKTKLLDQLKSQYPFTNGQNFVRFVEAVDVFIASKKKRQQGIVACVFIIPEQKWYYPKTEDELMDIAVSHIEFYLQNPKSKTMKYSSEYKGPKLTDSSIMTYGKHKGERMIEIPAEYLVYCFENNMCSPAVAFYVSENLDNLRKEIANKKKGIR